MARDGYAHWGAAMTPDDVRIAALGLACVAAALLYVLWNDIKRWWL